MRFLPLLILTGTARRTWSVPGSGGGFQVLFGVGDGTFQELPLVNKNLFPGTVNVVDINGDGKLDLVSKVADVSRDFDIEVFFGNGDGTFGSPIAIGPPLGCCNMGAYQLVGVGDFYRHNLSDLALGLAISDNVVATFRNVSAPAPDFVLAASSVSPATVAPGSSGSATISLTSVGGFAGSVALSCSALPSGATCSFALPSLVVGTSSSLVHERTVILTVATSVGVTTVSLGPNVLTFAQQATQFGTDGPTYEHRHSTVDHFRYLHLRSECG